MNTLSSSILGPLLRGGASFLVGTGLAARLEPMALFSAAKVEPEDDPGALEPLRALTESIASDLDFSPLGQVLFGRRMVDVLQRRAWLLRAEAEGRLPEPASVAPPLVVCGFPRTGTTLSHRVLSLAPGARAPQWCELMEPILPPDVTPARARARRLRRFKVAGRLLDVVAPGLRRIHELVPAGPEECTNLHELALDSESFALLGPVRHYRDWLDGRDQARRSARYEWHVRGLRAIAADRLDQDRGSRWVLKAPQHVLQMPDLLAAHPGAKIIRMHRDPTRVMASTASLVETSSRMFNQDFDQAVGEDLLETFEEWKDRGDRDLSRVEGHVLEVHYDDLVADPIRFVELVHDFAGLPVEGCHLDAVRGHLESRPRHHFGRHAYRIEDYGITADEIEDRLEEHRDRIEGLRRWTTSDRS